MGSGAAREQACGMDLRAELEQAEATTLADSDGKSGALLERATLPDGRAVVVKRSSPSTDLFMRVLGDDVGRELVLLETGVLDRLPDAVGHCLLDGWRDGDETVVVMRDLGDAVAGWDARLSSADVDAFASAVAALHRAFRDRVPEGLAPPEPVLATFDPARLAAIAGPADALAAVAVSGWEVFGDLVEAPLAEEVLALVHDPGPLVAALGEHAPTLCHADLAPVNHAWEGDCLTLLDWGQAVALPGEVDVARFLAGSSQVLDTSREDLIRAYATAAGPAYDATAMRLALLSGLVWLGWNKAYDAVWAPSPEKREREQQDLAWWVERAREALVGGL
jgi:hypothetical protein